MDFAQRLHRRIRETDSRVCLGIDPRPGLSPLTAPENHGGDPARVADAVVDYFRTILEATHGLLACCKPQAAFFEALGLAGLDALARVMAIARELEVPIILDGKRGDIGSTSEAYARAYLEDGVFAADALTVNAYLGLDTLEPFLDRAQRGGRGLFVLVKTSNPGSADLQDLRLESGDLLHQALADRLTERARALPSDAAGYTALGAVVAATYPQELRELRTRLPNSVLLVPGYGAQGGSAADVAAAFDDEGMGAVVNASRSLTYLAAQDEAELARAAARAAGSMRDALNLALAERA